MVTISNGHLCQVIPFVIKRKKKLEVLVTLHKHSKSLWNKYDLRRVPVTPLVTTQCKVYSVPVEVLPLPFSVFEAHLSNCVESSRQTNPLSNYI